MIYFKYQCGYQNRVDTVNDKSMSQHNSQLPGREVEVGILYLSLETYCVFNQRHKIISFTASAS